MGSFLEEGREAPDDRRFFLRGREQKTDQMKTSWEVEGILEPKKHGGRAPLPRSSKTQNLFYQ